MKRKDFIKKGVLAMSSLSAFNAFTGELKQDGFKMPVLFIGHGSPMNGIENNEFSAYWEKLGKELPVPKVVLVVSAHWLTKGTHITAMPSPKTIHDFGGFPEALHAVQYPAPGDPLLAGITKDLITSTNVGLDHDWGLDHGAWTVVRRMYPKADIPVLQLSIDYSKPAACITGQAPDRRSPCTTQCLWRCLRKGIGKAMPLKRICSFFRGDQLYKK